MNLFNLIKNIKLYYLLKKIILFVKLNLNEVQALNNKTGEFIKNRREKLNISQENLALKLFVTRQAISNWENGKSIPNYDNLLKLSEILNVSIIDLYAGEIVNDNLQANETIKAISNSIKIKFKKIIMLFIIIIIMLIISFLSYYFLNSYNTVKVYTIVGENKNFKTDTGLFILTRKNIYFKLNILPKNKAEVNNIILRYKTKKENKFLLETDDTEIYLKDFYGYNAYFDYNEMIKEKGSFLIEIKTKENKKEILELKLTKDFENNNVIFKQDLPITNDKKKEPKKHEIPKKVLKNFKKFDTFYELKKKDTDHTTIITYQPNTHFLEVEEIYNNFEKYWRYDIERKDLYYLEYSLDNDILNDIPLNIKDYKNKKEKVLGNYFKKNYIEKYL